MPFQIPQDIDFTKATRVKWANAPRGYHVDPTAGCWGWLLRTAASDDQYELLNNPHNDNFTGTTLPREVLIPTLPYPAASATGDESEDEPGEAVATARDNAPSLSSGVGVVDEAVSPNIAAYSASAPQPGYNTADHSNRFERDAYDQASWRTNGDFIIDLDQFLVNQLPIVDQENRPKRLSFGLVGCHGVNTGYAIEYLKKNKVAMKVAARELSVAGRHHFNFVLGDNFYHFGVTDPRSDLFFSCFHKYFKNTQCFSILGNHDYNMHGEADGPLSTRLFRLAHLQLPKRYRAMCQVYHSYITPRLLDPFHEMGHSNVWNMPFSYYAMVARGIQAVFICIDSNTLAFDAVQQIWLIETYARLHTELPTYNFILISHHPLEYYSERAFKKKEWKKYRQSKDSGLPRKPFKVLGAFNHGQFKFHPGLSTDGDMSNIDTIGHILKDFLQTYNLHFKAIFAAHEHLLAFEKIRLVYADGSQENVPQFISGGGGAKLNGVDRRISASRPSFQDVSTKFFSQYGYMRVILDQNQLHVNFYGIKSATRIHSENIILRGAQAPTA
ncbi:MAG: hypothetical protein EXR81_03045 [Gammaproteobacteria bacterium]|nr:hypothetical protein [Gammaproteobacteria bacterium]